MKLSGTLKRNNKPNRDGEINFNFKGNKYFSKKNIENVEEFKKNLLLDYSDDETQSKKEVKFNETEKGIYMNFTKFINSSDLDERVINQVDILAGDRTSKSPSDIVGLESVFDTKDNSIDNITSPIIAPQSIGGILRNSIKPSSIKEGEQTVAISGNLLVNEDNDKPSALAVNIPIMNKKQEVYSVKVTNELKSILSTLGLYSKIISFTDKDDNIKCSLSFFINLEDNEELQNIISEMNGNNFVSINANVSDLKKRALGIISGKVIETNRKQAEDKVQDNSGSKKRPAIPDSF